MKKILNALKGNGCQARMLTAAMVVLSAMAGLTSCANEDTALDNTTAQTAEGRTVQFTATLAPKGEAQPELAEGNGDNGGQTRAITVNDQNNANESLNVAWKEGEKIAVYYQTGETTYATATATVGTPNGDGSAPITATLTDAKAGGTAKFVYPATLHDGQGDINKSKLKNSQQGLLTGDNSISTNFDAAKDIAMLSVTADKAVTADRIKMKNQCCICKFNISISRVLQELSDATHYNISIVFDGGENYYLSAVPKNRLSALYVAMLPEASAKCTIIVEVLKSSDGGQTVKTLGTYKKIINSVTLAADHFYRNVPVIINQPALTATTGNITITASTGELLLGNGAVLDGTGGVGTRLMIAAGATVTLKDVTNTGITKAENIAGIECLGDATIILEGTNSVAGRENAPGIFIPKGCTLTIRGSGSLTATGGSTSQTGAGSGHIGGAGIGGTMDISCGNIVIEGGTITATGTGHSAGIGSGYARGAATTCGDISISGSAQVNATGGTYAAGIGSGKAEVAANTCGDISISGPAQVTATGGQYAAGIGSGDNNTKENKCGDISISGSAKVTATGGANAAGIGSGNGNRYDSNIYVSSCGAISITGGTIEARGGDHAAGIGSGWNGKFTSISITSGITRVTATRSNDYWNAPIGKGFDDRGSGGITIDGQTISDAMTKGTVSLPTFQNLSITITGGKDSFNNDMANKTWTITRK